MSNSPRNLKIVIINGSVRSANYTSMASALVADELRQQDVSLTVINPAELNLPLPGLDYNAPGAHKLQEAVREATGVILATPEYHGSISSVTKLVIENLGFPSVLAGKPVALLGVAAGAIGAIKSLEQLRGICAHIGAVALPLAVSVANVQQVFDKDGRCLDANLEKLIRGVAKNLLDYIHQNICPRVTLERILREGVAAAV